MRIVPRNKLPVAAAMAVLVVLACGCPPEPAEQAGPPKAYAGDWVFEVQDRLSGELGEPPIKIGARLYEDGTVGDSPAHDNAFSAPMSWSQSGGIFRLRTDEYPYFVYEAVVERPNYLEGEYHDDANPSFAIGTFTARWIYAPYEGDPPDTQI